MSGTAVLVAAVIFGLVASLLALLAVPASDLIGVMFGAMSMVMTASAPSIGSMNNFYTLLILPMFYVYGVFCRLHRLPDTVRRLAWILPLTPAAALTRSPVTAALTLLMLLWLLESLAFTVVAFGLAALLLKRRLIR